MKSLTQYFKKLLPQLSEEDKEIVPVTKQNHEWQETEHLQYLMQTIKLKYQSASGAITLEDLTPEQAVSIIKDVTTDADHPMAQVKDNQGTPSPIEISVCAVSLESSGEERRVRAIPNAACLRLINLNTPNMDVYYEHLNPNRTARDDVSSSPLAPINGSKIYKGDIIHPLTFFKTLEHVNDNNKMLLDMNSGISSENFDEILTSHELKKLNDFSF